MKINQCKQIEARQLKVGDRVIAANRDTIDRLEPSPGGQFIIAHFAEQPAQMYRMRETVYIVRLEDDHA